MRYRPDIDGLRAIAVLAVVISHAEFHFDESLILPGGFFGVDIFFVISGFLITTLITEEFKLTQQFSFLSFYERRARRLLPLLLIVTLVSFPVAWFLLLPEKIIDFSKSAIWSNLFISNFYWVESLQKYGADSAVFKPLLHTWSLSVEEQFYIIFPATLIILYKWLKPYAVLILTLIALASLLYAEHLGAAKPMHSFYLLFSRLWELLLGGGLVFLSKRYKHKNIYLGVVSLLPFLGLCLISYALIFIDFSASKHPGMITVIPVLGTALIIGFSNKNLGTTRFLSNNGMVKVGLISYSLYLWHFPVFAFLRIGGVFETNFLKVIAVILVFILSISSYKLIEQPFRSSKKTPSKKFIGLIVVGLSLVIVLNLMVIRNDGFPKRYSKAIVQGVAEMKSYRKKYWESNSVYKKTEAFTAEAFSVYVIGNSWAKDIANALLEMSSFEVGFDGMTGHRCKAITLNALKPQNKKYLETKALCEEKNVLRFTKELPNTNLVVVADNLWLAKVDDQQVVNEVKKNINRLRKYGYSGPILIIANRPTYKKGVFEIINEYGAIGSGVNSYAQKYLTQSIVKLANQDKYAEKFYKANSVFYYSLVGSLCGENGPCKIIENSMPLYFDRDHLTKSGARLIGKDLLKYIEDEFH